MRLLLPLILSLAPLCRAQEPSPYAMDYGPVLALTAEGFDPDDVAYKGRALFLGDRAGVLFDTELLRVTAGFVGGRLELRGTAFDGGHGAISRVRGTPVIVTPHAPGWASAGEFDARATPYGPLPRERARFLGHFFHGERVVLHYRVGQRQVHETFDVLDGEPAVIVRTLRIGPGEAATAMLFDASGLAPEAPRAERSADGVEVHWTHQREPRKEGEPPRRDDWTSHVVLDGENAELRVEGAAVVLAVPSSRAPVIVRIAHATVTPGAASPEPSFDALAAPDFDAWTRGGPRRYPETLSTAGERGADDGAFAVDTATVPASNPWRSRLRFGAFDFLDDTTAALSTWNGDVWLVSGLDDDLDQLSWSRFCTGLHDPLGLKVVDGVIHTLGRDGIQRLHDLNGDGECDRVEVFNDDVFVTRSFHEFAFDLQVDAEGNFYFSKGGPVKPGGRGFDEITPHHGTVMRVTKDGSRLEVVATGLRAPDGIAVTPDGVVTTGDNQGTWMPVCRLNITTNGTFMGCVDTAHRQTPPTEYDPPICFLPMSVDNSGGGQMWVPEDTWGPLAGELLHQSYGQSAIYLVLRQQVDGVTQGGVVRLPAEFDSAQMRGRFIGDELWVCGFKGWQTNAVKDTAFQRVRRTERPLHLPIAMEVFEGGVRLGFSDVLDPETAADPESYEVQIWNYAWTEAYGSPEVKPSDPSIRVEEGVENRDTLAVTGARLADDGRTVFLTVEGLREVMQTRIAYSVDAADGTIVEGAIHGTIHALPDRPGEARHAR